VPPLRERLDDVAILARAILDDVAGPLGISPATVAALCTHDWPGNVRELKNVLARAAALADSRMLEPRHLMLYKPRAREPAVEELPLAGRTLETLERAAVRQTLEREGGNRTRTAKALGIAPSTLYEKLKKYGLS
jgi:DNA-binding NtrC family response regulator